MVLFYRHAPHLARPAFIIFNVSLVGAGLACYFRWMQPGRPGARTVIRAWVGAEAFNAAVHLVWAIIIHGYNPGLITGLAFVPVLAYLSYQLSRAAV